VIRDMNRVLRKHRRGARVCKRKGGGRNESAFSVQNQDSRKKTTWRKRGRKDMKEHSCRGGNSAPLTTRRKSRMSLTIERFSGRRWKRKKRKGKQFKKFGGGAKIAGFEGGPRIHKWNRSVLVKGGGNPWLRNKSS